MPVYKLDGYRYEIDTENYKYRVISDGDPVQFVDWLPFFAFVPIDQGFMLVDNKGITKNVRAAEVSLPV